MEILDLRRLVRQGEHQQLEFKRKANFPERIVCEMVAFANSEGGKLLVGVDDDGSIYGCKSWEEDAFVLKQTLERIVFPALELRLQRAAVDARREVLIYDIAASSNKPHFVREGDRKVAYVRVQDRCMQASREMVELMRAARRSRGVSLTIGEPEGRLLRHLEQAPLTTLDETAQLLNFSRRKASELLIRLVRAGLLHIKPTEKQDVFTLAHEAFV